MRMTLNTEPWDYAGPMAYNSDMKKHVMNSGKPVDELKFVPDEADPEYSKDIWVVHVPSGKVNAYKAYLDKDGDVRMFNGLFDQKIDGMSDLLVMYKDDFRPEEPYRSFNDDRLDAEMKKIDRRKVWEEDILNRLKEVYESKGDKMSHCGIPKQGE